MLVRHKRGKKKGKEKERTIKKNNGLYVGEQHDWRSHDKVKIIMRQKWELNLLLLGGHSSGT